MRVAKLDIPFIQACATFAVSLQSYWSGERVSLLALLPKIGVLCKWITSKNNLGLDIIEPQVT
jgi:hypothetical protein